MKIITFYLPQFHEIPENNEWWGKGFTEWVNVKKAQPLYEGHEQPRVPLNENYYNLLDPNVQVWQAKIAKEYGVYGFCYYHYWFNGKLLLEKPMENMLKNRDIDIPFCVCWANEPWTRAWVGETKVLIPQLYGEKREWNKPIESLEFSSTRYFMKYEKYNCSWSGYFFASRKGSLFVKVVDEVFREYYLKYKDYSTYFFIDMVLMMCKKYGLDDNALDNIHFADGDMMLMLRTLGDEYNKCYLSQYEAVPQKLEWRYKGKGKKNTNYCHYIQNGIQDRRSET